MHSETKGCGQIATVFAHCKVSSCFQCYIGNPWGQRKASRDARRSSDALDVTDLFSQSAGNVPEGHH